MILNELILTDEAEQKRKSPILLVGGSFIRCYILEHLSTWILADETSSSFLQISVSQCAAQSASEQYCNQS